VHGGWGRVRLPLLAPRPNLPRRTGEPVGAPRAIDRHRAWCVRPRETHSIDDLNLPVQDAADRILDTQLVLDALPQLTAQQRQILALTYYRGCPVAEIAELLDIPRAPSSPARTTPCAPSGPPWPAGFAATDPLIRCRAPGARSVHPTLPIRRPVRLRRREVHVQGDAEVRAVRVGAGQA